MTENRSKWIESRRASGGKPINIAENRLQKFRMEGGAQKHLTGESSAETCRKDILSISVRDRKIGAVCHGAGPI